MKISALTQGLGVNVASGPADATITDIVEDSRQATRGCLFIARSGVKADGRKYINDAIAAGAIAVLTDSAIDLPKGVTLLTTSDVPGVMARAAERYFGEPTSRLKLIGITGTNGKTTTAYLVRHFLNAAGLRCGLIGTVQIDDGAEVIAANLTTPPAIELSRLMRSMVDHGCSACVMEASSHALHQMRTAGLQFRVGVFTNLTGDHLDYHQTMEAYLDAKAILFESLPADGFAILNVDDAAAAQMAARTQANVVSCSLRDHHATCFAAIGEQSLSGIEALFSGPWGKIECKLPLVGRHNVCNALQALTVAHCIGVNRDGLQHALNSCKAPPGRLEPVTTADDEFAVLVDYAHTDDALENVLRALRPIVQTAGGKLRVVFGCGGDRDRTKRPRMAKVACRFADDVLITSDNPRTEDPQAILEEIRTGVPDDRLDRVTSIVDREVAIRAAIDRLGPGDILLIAGKGHEDYQIIGTTKRPFDDRLVAAAALAERKKVMA